MILDFLKRHWILVYSVLGADLFCILLITKFYLHESIKIHLGIFVFMFLFMILVSIAFHKFIDEKTTVSVRVEGNILILLLSSIYTSIQFFFNPAEYADYGSTPFFALPYVLWCIFFARKDKLCGCWFKKNNVEN